MCAFTYVHARLGVELRVHVSSCMHACVYARTHVRTHVRMCVCVCSYVCVDVMGARVSIRKNGRKTWLQVELWDYVDIGVLPWHMWLFVEFWDP